MTRRTTSDHETAPATPTPRPRPASRRSAAAPRGPRRWWRYGMLVVCGVLLVNALAGERGYLEYRRLEARVAEAEAELAGIRAQNQALQHRARRLKSDPVAIEREVRDQLGYAREGEVVFTIRDAPAPSPAPAAPKAAPAAAPAPSSGAGPSR